MRKAGFICALLIGSASFVAAQVASHQQAIVPTPSRLSMPTGKPVAKVNGVVLTDRDLLREEYAIFPYAKQHNGSIPKELEPGIRKGALEMIIFEELVYQEALRRKMTVSEARIDKAEADFKKQYKPAEFQQYLRQEFGGSEKKMRERIRRSLLIDELLKIEVTQKSKVSLPELQAYYDKNSVRFLYPESFAIQTITIMAPAKATAAQLQEAKKRAEGAYKQAKETKDSEQFGLLAEKISEDDYRVKLGDHGWVPRDKMPPEMLHPALKMKAGEMSNLIQVGPYYVIFRMNRHVPAGKFKFSEVKDDLRTELEKKKVEQTRSAFNRRLRQNATVEML